MSLEVYPQSGPPGPIGPTASVLFSAGTLSSTRSDITFANSNGVTFGLDGAGVITATVQTNYQSAGAYLTTAMASNRGSDFVQATAGFHGTNASGTIASSGISVSVNAGGGSLNISAGSTSSNVSAVTFSNGSGVTFGFDGSNVTASVQTNYQTPGAYLTTAALSQDSSKYAGTNGSVETTSGTDLTLTLNTSGATIAYPKWLTTAMASNAATISNINISGGTTSSNVSAITFSNANNVTFGYDGTNITASATVASTQDNINVSAGTTSQNLSAITFADTVGLSFGLSGSQITGKPAIGVSAGTLAATLGAYTFSNSNNVSFGQAAGGTITASIATTYAGTGFTTATTTGTNIVGTLNTSGLSMGVPAYLTTTPAGGAGTGFTSTSTAGSNIVGTLDTNGLSVGVPNYLTTAMASNASTITAIKVSAGTNSFNVTAINFSQAHNVVFGLGTGASSTVVTASAPIRFQDSVHFVEGVGIEFDNSNGVTFGLDTLAFVYTASVKTDYAGINTSVVTTTGTDLSFAANTSGITIAYPKWITASGAGTGFTTATTAGTVVVGTLNSNGLSMGVPAYLTTAALSGDTSKYAGTATSVATTTGTDLSMALNTNGLTVAYPKWITTYTPGIGGVSNSQTLFSTGTVALSEGGGAITIASSAGGQSLMFSVPQTSSIVGVAPASISTSGSTISVQVSAIMGLGVSNTGNTAGNVGYLTGSNYALAGSGSITLSQSTAAGAATAWIQHPAWLTTAALSGDTSKYAGINGSVATTAGTDLALTINTSGATIGYPKWITTAAVSSAMKSYFENIDMLDPGSATLSAGISVLQVVPFVLHDAMSIGFLRLPVSMSYVSTEASGTTANSTWTVNVSYTDAAMILVQNSGNSSLSLKSLTSGSATWVFQNQIQAGAQGSRYTVTQNVTYPVSGTTSNYTTSYPQSSANIQISSASMTLFTGPRWLDIPMPISLSGSNYWLALGRSTNSATQAGNAALGGASAGFSYIGVSQNNLSIGFPGAVTNSSIQLQPGLGSWSTNSAVMTTASIQLASISAMSSGAKPYFQFIRYA